MLRIDNLNLQNSSGDSSLTIEKVEIEKLLPILKTFNLPLEDFYEYKVNGLFDEINISFSSNNLSKQANFDSTALLDELVITGLFSNITIAKEEKNLFYLE